MKATELILKIQNKTGSAREKEILEAINSDYIPEFLKSFAEIIVEHNGDRLQYFVSKDYFCLGEDDDYIVTPTIPAIIKPLLIKWDCSLPTPKMVKQIYNQAQIKIPARPQRAKAGESVTATRLYVEIDKAIKKERLSLNAELDKLIAGHKKDVVLSNSILRQVKKDRIAIYGWFYANGEEIQKLNAKDHNDRYVDYSQGFRLVSNKCILNGIETTLKSIWDHPVLCLLINDEILKFQSY